MKYTVALFALASAASALTITELEPESATVSAISSAAASALTTSSPSSRRTTTLTSTILCAETDATVSSSSVISSDSSAAATSAAATSAVATSAAATSPAAVTSAAASSAAVTTTSSAAASSAASTATTSSTCAVETFSCLNDDQYYVYDGVQYVVKCETAFTSRTGSVRETSTKDCIDVCSSDWSCQATTFDGNTCVYYSSSVISGSYEGAAGLYKTGLTVIDSCSSDTTSSSSAAATSSIAAASTATSSAATVTISTISSAATTSVAATSAVVSSDSTSAAATTTVSTAAATTTSATVTYDPCEPVETAICAYNGGYYQESETGDLFTIECGVVFTNFLGTGALPSLQSCITGCKFYGFCSAVTYDAGTCSYYRSTTISSEQSGLQGAALLGASC